MIVVAAIAGALIVGTVIAWAVIAVAGSGDRSASPEAPAVEDLEPSRSLPPQAAETKAR